MLGPHRSPVVALVVQHLSKGMEDVQAEIAARERYRGAGSATWHGNLAAPALALIADRWSGAALPGRLQLEGADGRCEIALRCGRKPACLGLWQGHALGARDALQLAAANVGGERIESDVLRSGLLERLDDQALHAATPRRAHHERLFTAPASTCKMIEHSLPDSRDTATPLARSTATQGGAASLVTTHSSTGTLILHQTS